MHDVALDIRRLNKALDALGHTENQVMSSRRGEWRVTLRTIQWRLMSESPSVLLDAPPAQPFVNVSLVATHSETGFRVSQKGYSAWDYNASPSPCAISDTILQALVEQKWEQARTNVRAWVEHRLDRLDVCMARLEGRHLKRRVLERKYREIFGVKAA